MRRDAMQKILGISMLLVVMAWVMPGPAWGQGAVLDDDDPELIDDDEKLPEASSDDLDAPLTTEFGVGLRLRNVSVPESFLETFVEDVPGGISHVGIGVEFIRRKGDFEINLGIEYESLTGTDGLWLDKGDTIPQDEVDLVQFEDFAWVTADVTFVWHAPVHEMFAIRYGAGVGLGYVMGDVLRTDYVCSGTELVVDPGQCIQKPGAENIRASEDKVPPVFPVLNALIGGQLRPVEQVAINFEVGFRTLFYVGTTVAYFF
jgi:hypothetical protein